MMKCRLIAVSLFVGLMSAHAARSDDAILSLATQSGTPVVDDDFTRDEIAPWQAKIPTFLIRDDVLVGRQTRDDHGAVGAIPVDYENAVIAFRFRLEGTKTFNVVSDDKLYKGSHAGHIWRVAVAPTQIRLGDDKEGIMRNDIFEMRRDPARKAAADKLIEDRGAVFKRKIDQHRWYTMLIAVRGNELTVELDGEEVGRLTSPGIAHQTKRSVHFTVTGGDALFDDVQVWRLPTATTETVP
ncbi:MAG: hypothetical protein KDA75_09540 [Planctomycetaceae bacterium]|nr:hypothetical protein [Planctomycetaceae bacterium]